MPVPTPSLNIVPFPRLDWDEYYWSAKINLPAWKGFQCRPGPYASQEGSLESDGTVEVTIHVPSDREPTPPSAEQATAYRHLIEEQDAIRDTILQLVFDDYPEQRRSCILEFDLGESALPVIARPEQLKMLIGLSSIHIHCVARDGIAYVGYEFGCVWEEEHGLGTMMHRCRVVDFGQADSSILEWIAERDAKSTKKKS